MNNNYQNASFSLRFLATTTEFFIFLSFHLLFLLFLVQSNSLQQFFYNFIFYLVVLMLSPLGFLHSLLFTHYFGGTVGKLLTGLRVVDNLNQRLNFKRVFFRQTIGYQFSGLVFGLGFLSILKDENKLAWHDKASGSKVIVVKPLWVLSIILAVLLCILNLYLAVSVFNKAFSSPLPGQISELFEASTKLPQLQETESSPSASPKLYLN